MKVFKITPPVPEIFQTKIYETALVMGGVLLLLSEIGLIVLTFVVQSWIPAAAALTVLALSIIEMRLGEAVVRTAMLNYAAKQTELELDKRRKSEYN